MLSLKFLKSFGGTALAATVGLSATLIALAELTPDYKFSKTSTYGESSNGTLPVGYSVIQDSNSNNLDDLGGEISSTITLKLEKKIELSETISAKAVMGDLVDKTQYSLRGDADQYIKAVDVTDDDYDGTWEDFNKAAWAHCFDDGTTGTTPPMQFKIMCDSNDTKTEVTLWKEATAIETDVLPDDATGDFKETWKNTPKYHGVKDEDGKDVYAPKFTIKSFKAETLKDGGTNRLEYSASEDVADVTDGYLILTWELAINGASDLDEIYYKDGKFYTDSGCTKAADGVIMNDLQNSTEIKYNSEDGKFYKKDNTNKLADESDVARALLAERIHKKFTVEESQTPTWYTSSSPELIGSGSLAK